MENVVGGVERGEGDVTGGVGGGERSGGERGVCGGGGVFGCGG